MRAMNPSALVAMYVMMRRSSVMLVRLAILILDS